VNGNVKQRRAAARSGEWAQHFSNASCYTARAGMPTVTSIAVAVVGN